MGVLEDVRAAMRAMLEPKPDSGPLKLFVPPSAFDRGEDWVRRAYGVGPDTEIVESVPIAYPADSARPPRRYPSALERG